MLLLRVGHLGMGLGLRRRLLRAAKALLAQPPLRHLGPGPERHPGRVAKALLLLLHPGLGQGRQQLGKAARTLPAQLLLQQHLGPSLGQPRRRDSK